MIKRNIKMMVTPEQSKQVQEICFANGIGWSSKDFIPILLNKEYLMIRDVITYNDKKKFCESNLEEVDASLFIRTNGTCVEETPKQELKQNTNKEETMEKNEVESYADNLEYLSDFWNKEETMEKNEVKSYADVKEYLIAKGLYERVLEIDWDYGGEPTEFSEFFIWDNVEEGFDFWNAWDDDLIELRIEKNIDSLVQDYKAKHSKEFIEHIETQLEQELKQNTNKEETMKDNEVESYTNVKEYLIAKGLYEDVLSFDIDVNGYSPNFANLFYFDETPQGIDFWYEINSELLKLGINAKIDEILVDYGTKKLEVVEAKPLEKPKQYLCYVQGKALPKHIHKTLEQAKQEAQRLCRKELAKVSVLEVVAEYEAQVFVKLLS